MQKPKRRIIEIPLNELQKDMAEYGKKKAHSLRSSRIFLRSLGMKITPGGEISC